MNNQIPHISVCICTYKRLRFLKRLLNGVGAQVTEGQFTYSVVVADNDQLRSAEPIVSEFKRASPIPVTYCVEPQQNIALTRNRAIANASGDYIAFVDDDEFPAADWLLCLFKACGQHKADGVIGSVKPEYEGQPPSWIVRGKFHVRSTYPTGFVINWRQGRTGNLLFKRSLIKDREQAFRSKFLTGEDQDFFRRMIERGGVFVWCHEALAREAIPASRWSRSFMLRSALLRGKISLLHPSFRALEFLKSTLAVALYTLALPIVLLGGQHNFMKYLIKTFYHLGRLLASIGVDLTKGVYVTE